nr:hypothetical protein [uncultured Lichenicoccus sp.]
MLPLLRATRRSYAAAMPAPNTPQQQLPQQRRLPAWLVVVASMLAGAAFACACMAAGHFL